MRRGKRHPTLGEVPPAEFLPVAERAGAIGDLMRWALERAASAVVALPSSGAPLRIGLKLPAGSRLISVMRGGRAEIPDSDTELQAGDQALAILEPGKEDELRRVLLKK